MDGCIHLFHTDLNAAYRKLLEVDIEALETMYAAASSIRLIQNEFIKTLQAGGRIFLFGCGSSGRLLVLLEKIILNDHPKYRQQFISIMAGGDIALARSIPVFEDYASYGLKQLQQSGWSASKDLLLGISASGTARFILEMIQHAAQYSNHKPIFIFNNPIEQLKCRLKGHPILDKSIAENIKFVSLDTGPMAITGSTRMQAATVCMLAVGLAMQNSIQVLEKKMEGSIEDDIATFITNLKEFNFRELIKFIELETKCYKNDDRVLYVADSETALPILLDTTERNATFNLPPFINQFDSNPQQSPPFCFLHVNNCKNAKDAWQNILGRLPQSLNWEEVPETNEIKLSGFDFSQLNPTYAKNSFDIFYDNHGNGFLFGFKEAKVFIPAPNNALLRHVLLKLVLNNHSTITMGLLGYYNSNIMTHLAPSNAKLIYRGAYYAWRTLKYLDYNNYSLPPQIRKRYSFAEVEACFINNLIYTKPNLSIINLIKDLLIDRFRTELYTHFLALERYSSVHLKFKAQILDKFVYQLTGHSISNICKIVGGAGDRNYFRILSNNSSFILMDSANWMENKEFLAITKILKSVNIKVPEIFHYDINAGLMLLSDLGDNSLLSYLQDCLDKNGIIFAYQKAIDIIFAMHYIDPTRILKAYSPDKLKEEMGYFKKYFIEGFLKIDLTTEQESQLNQLIDKVLNNLSNQPKKFTHKDFQSTNIMVHDNTFYLLDYQSALQGYYTYDLVCLLRDCYFTFSPTMYQELLNYFKSKLAAMTTLPISVQPERISGSEQVTKETENLIGGPLNLANRNLDDDIVCAIIHRHLKTPGTFAYLHLIKNKSNYLKFIKTSLQYLLTAAEAQEDFYDLAILLLQLNYGHLSNRSRIMSDKIFIWSSILHMNLMADLAKVVIVTGVASSGKTSLVKTLIETTQVPIAYISIDEIKIRHRFNLLHTYAPDDFKYFATKFGLSATYYIDNFGYEENPFVKRMLTILSIEDRAVLEEKAKLLKDILSKHNSSFHQIVMEEAYRLIQYYVSCGYVTVIDVANIQQNNILKYLEAFNYNLIDLFCDLTTLCQRIKVRNQNALIVNTPLNYRHPLVAFEQYFQNYKNELTLQTIPPKHKILSKFSTLKLEDLLNNILDIDSFYHLYRYPVFKDLDIFKQNLLAKCERSHSLIVPDTDKSLQIVTTKEQISNKRSFTLFSTNPRHKLSSTIKFIILKPVKHAIILAAGKGTRMGEINKHKSLMMIGSLSLIEHQIKKLRDIGVENIVITVHHRKQEIITHLGNGSRYGVDIQYSIENEILDTGGGFYQAYSLIRDDSCQFFLLSADCWHQLDLTQLEIPQGKSAHVVLREGNATQTLRYALEQSNLVNGNRYFYCGIGLFKSSYFDKLNIKEKKFPLHELIKIGIEEEFIAGSVYEGQYVNINTLQDLELANLLYADLSHNSTFYSY